MNLSRVVLAGLLAGAVLNVGEFLLNGVVLAKQMEAVFERFKVPPPGPPFLATATLLTFVIGILLVAMYALARPRLGPGPKTAVVVALILWFGVYVYTGVINGMVFGLPMSIIAIGIAWGFVEYTIASVVGAWAYKE